MGALGQRGALLLLGQLLQRRSGLPGRSQDRPRDDPGDPELANSRGSGSELWALELRGRPKQPRPFAAARGLDVRLEGPPALAGQGFPSRDLSEAAEVASVVADRPRWKARRAPRVG